MLGVHGRPNDERGFVHKRIFGGIEGFLRGGPVGAIGGFLTGGGGGGDRAVPQAARGCPPGFLLTARGCEPTAFGAPAPVPGRFTGIRLGGPSGVQIGIQGQGFFPPQPPTAAIVQEGGEDFGAAVMGQYGAGLEPAVRGMTVRVCPRGTVLGTDGICYNRRDIRNSERFWPRGRRPLLTGGEMRCISIASAASKKLQRKQKQLQDLGMLPKPTRRSRPALAAGHVAVIKHD